MKGAIWKIDFTDLSNLIGDIFTRSSYNLVYIYTRGSFINHVDRFLDIFDPPAPHPLVDKHGFLADPPKNHVGPLKNSNLFRFLKKFSALFVMCWFISDPKTHFIGNCSKSDTNKAFKIGSHKTFLSTWTSL